MAHCCMDAIASAVYSRTVSLNQYLLITDLILHLQSQQRNTFLLIFIQNPQNIAETKTRGSKTPLTFIPFTSIMSRQVMIMGQSKCKTKNAPDLLSHLPLYLHLYFYSTEVSPWDLKPVH